MAKAPKKVNMDRKRLAYRTRPHENEYYAKKFGVSMEVFRDIVENLNMNGKPCTSLPKVQTAIQAWKDEQKLKSQEGGNEPNNHPDGNDRVENLPQA